MATSTVAKIGEFRDFLGERVWGLFVRAVLIGICWFLVESSFVYVLQGFLMALGLLKREEAFVPEWYPSSVMGAVLILVAFGVVRSCVIMLRFYYGNATSQAFMRFQRNKILRHALHFAHQESLPEVLSIFGERVGQAGSVLQQIAQFINLSVALALFFLFGLSLAPRELLLGTLFLAILVLPLKLLGNVIDRSGKGLVVEWENSVKILVQGFKNFFFLKIHGLTEKTISEGEDKLYWYEKHYTDYYKVGALRNAYPLLAGSLVISALTYISIEHFQTPSVKLLAFFYIFIRFAQGASEVNSVWAEIRLQREGFRKLLNWSKKHGLQVIDPAPKKVSFSLKPDFRFEARDLSFAYEGSKSVFDHLSFSIQRGEIFLIKGESGSGKSTLVSVLLGFFEPTRGQLLIDGHPIREVLDSLYREIGYVGPEPYLIQGTVRENLLYGHHSPESVSDGAIWLALRRAQIEDEVKRLGRGLDEELLEYTQLSTGQQQRLSIARALLRNPKILIMDEATANIDSRNEQNLIEILKVESKDMAIVAISHKDSFDAIATKKITLERKSHG